MAATLGLGGSVFDLLDQATSQDPIVSSVKDLGKQIFSHPGSNDYATFEFNDVVSISGGVAPGKATFDFSRFTQLSASFVFGSQQSIGLAANLFNTPQDPEDLTTFGGGTDPSTKLNINLVKMVDISLETTYDSDSLDIGSLSIEPEDPNTGLFDNPA